MKILAINKRASFDYEILEKYEAGIELLGHEVKSIKTGHISIKEAFVTIKNNELFLTNSFVPLYGPAGEKPNYNPTRPRKLLLHKSQIKKLIGKSRIGGLTLIPIRVYTKRRFLKLEFALGKGKRKLDKRQKIQKREVERRMQRQLRG
jgi:SsrA-binding protein